MENTNNNTVSSSAQPSPFDSLSVDMGTNSPFNGSNSSAGGSNPFANAGSGNPLASAGGSNPMAGGSNPFTGGGDASSGGTPVSGDDLTSLLKQSPFGPLVDLIGAEALVQSFMMAGNPSGGNPFDGSGGNPSSGGDSPTSGSTNPMAGGGSNPFAGGSTNSSGNADSDNQITGNGNSSFSDGTWNFNNTDITSVGNNLATSGSNPFASAGNLDTSDSNPFFAGGSNPIANVSLLTDGTLTVNGWPLPFDDPTWLSKVLQIALDQANAVKATGNETIGNGNWLLGSDNQTVGNGNWYFSDGNSTVGNGNWYYGSDNATIGNGNWNLGDGNATIGNGNWYVGNDNSAIGNANKIKGDDNIALGNPLNGSISFSGSDSLIAGDQNSMLIVNRDAVTDGSDDLLSGGLGNISISDLDNDQLATSINYLVEDISQGFLNLLGSGWNSNQTMASTSDPMLASPSPIQDTTTGLI